MQADVGSPFPRSAALPVCCAQAAGLSPSVWVLRRPWAVARRGAIHNQGKNLRNKHFPDHHARLLPEIANCRSGADFLRRTRA